MLVNVGDVIAGRFEVERHVGAGGMGVVYRALDRDTSSSAALKLVRGTDRATNERFEREVTVLAELRHPNIVGYVTHGKTSDGALYLAMEWLEGEDLATRLSVGTLSAAETVEVARQAAMALALAHQRGVVHRDIKPSNLMLVENRPDRVKLLDFGIARLADIAPLTQTGAIIGTPLYMAPEQASGKSDIDARADVFALGAVMFHCLTGRCPFPARTVAELVARLAAPTEAPRVRAFAPETPPALDELVARMLAKDPAKRPRDAAAVLTALNPNVLAQPSMATAETGLVETPQPDQYDDAAARGQKALAEGRWADAKAAFTEALAIHDSGTARLGLAEAVQWLGDCRGCIEQLEAAYAQLRRANDPMAALAAIQLGVNQRKMMGNETASRGWLARAGRLLGNDAGPFHGYLWVASALDLDDPARAVELAARALESARKHNDRDLELIALGVQGYAMVVNGDLDGGMALIDESMAGIVGGEYDRLGTIVPTTCMMVNACHRMADVTRMVEWCRGAEQFIDKYGAPFMFADCRAHYGSALMLTGKWDEAERELAKAMQAAPVETDYHAIARSKLADLRVRQGRLDEANALLDELFDRACARPVAAKIKFAAGEAALASALLRRYVDSCGVNVLEAAAAADWLVDAALAAGDRETAALAVRKLREAATTHKLKNIAAHAAFAAGRFALDAGDADAAIPELERATELFTAANLPHEAARARLSLAQALAGKHAELAANEAKTAATAFERLGAKRDATAAGELLRTLGRGWPITVGASDP